MIGTLIVVLTIGSFASEADDLQALNNAAARFVVAMQSVLDLPMAADCFETNSRADEFAAAKVAYYKAAREAIPSLIQMAKGERTGNQYGEDLIELFRGSGQEADQAATEMLLSKLRECENSREQQTVQDAERVAEQFLKDFGQLDGV
ncbi:MAG: hypothetical protein JO025_03585 [Verrucomicrobia bacterium]|nr:hypothetical protein [Verrucomicrobiota bacterium]